MFRLKFGRTMWGLRRGCMDRAGWVVRVREGKRCGSVMAGVSSGFVTGQDGDGWNLFRCLLSGIYRFVSTILGVSQTPAASRVHVKLHRRKYPTKKYIRN